MPAVKKILAEPELLQRRDTERGRWSVTEARPVRGEPMTNNVTREMKVPSHDDMVARCIRAHEMMHAKISPAHDWDKWIKRGIASAEAMKAVEELRVNYLCTKAGFPMKEYLGDGSEMADGERIACTKDWATAVMMNVATIGTKSHKDFLTGIRRHNRVWGDALLDFSKRALKEIKKADKTGRIADTQQCSSSGLSPAGFLHTERLAEWLDRIAGIDPKEIEEVYAEKRAKKGAGKGKKSEGEATDADGDGEVTHTNVGVSGEDSKGRMTGNPFEGITPDKGHRHAPEWADLNVLTLPMPKVTKGNIGKKRIASASGSRPRRIHRMMTDPQMRIFDRKTKGNGGVVIIDASGSMSFTHDQIRQMVENAPGATVAIYTDRNQPGLPNMWVVADKGRMVSELPETGFGNGVDFPAIKWGTTKRQKSSSPMIWVTDGGVCGKNDNFTNILAMQCIKFCKQNNIVVVPHVEEAITQLTNLKNGGRAVSKWPAQFHHVYREMNGTELN